MAQTTIQTQQTQQTGLKAFNQTICSDRVKQYLNDVLGRKAAGFVNNLTALVANNTMLQNCQPLSVMYAAIKATALDLPLDNNLGFAYVIPYNNTKAGTTEAQFQIGYKAFIQLAQRSGQIRTINVRDVRQGEIMGEDFVSGELQFKALPADKRDKAPIIGYVGFFELVTGFRKMSYWSKEKIDAHAKQYSQTYRKGFGVWKDNFDAMAKKTVLKELLSKYAPLSTEMQNAIQNDQAVFNDKGEAEYLDNETTHEDLQNEVAEDVANKQGKAKVNTAELLKGAEEAQVVEETKPQSNGLFN